MQDQATLARALVDQLPAMVAYWDADLRCRFANRDYERWFGVSPAWLQGKHISELLGPLYALNLPYIQGALRGEAQEFERDIPDPSGGEPRHSLAYYLPDMNGTAVRGFFVLVTDITRRVRAERMLQQRERQLQASERVASMATLAAGMAHELNNPLATVMVNMELMADRLEAGSVDSAYMSLLVAEARQDAARMARIVHGMKLLARSDTNRDESFELARVIAQSVRLVWNDLRYRARLVQDVQNLGTVPGSAQQFAQLIVSLLRNATEAFGAADVERNQITLCARREQDMVVVEVSDNGCGIPPELQDKIFEPFYTTKEVGNVGLGLSISRSIAAAFGGGLTVRSQPGEGSTFSLRLPAAFSPAPELCSAAAPATRHRLAPASRPRILVIDDESSVAKVLTRMLSEDHQVTAVNRAQEAVYLLLTSDVHFDLILCDVMMPELAGPEVYETVVRARPELAPAFAFMTGGAFTPETRQFLERSRAPVIDKPFEVADVLTFVRAQLAK